MSRALENLSLEEWYQPERKGDGDDAGGKAAAEDPVTQDDRRCPGSEEDQKYGAEKLSGVFSPHIYPNCFGNLTAQTEDCPLYVAFTLRCVVAPRSRKGVRPGWSSPSGGD